jgi:hypothetical protein
MPSPVEQCGESLGSGIPITWRFEMTRSDLTPEDMFEKAREAFFGTQQPSTKPNDYSADFFKPRNETSSAAASDNSSD